MNEQYRQLSKLVGQDVTKRERQQRKKEQEERKVQQLFERYATAQLVAYEAGCAEKGARVQERYQKVILPWWGIVVESGLYEQLRKRSEKSDRFVMLNDTIEYYYPTGLYREFEEAPQLHHKPFTWRAEWLLEKVQSAPRRSEGGQPDIESLVRSEVENDWRSFWHANIYLSSSKQPFGLYVSQYPAGGGGCGFNGERYKRQIELGKETVTVGSLNPVVLLQFADQIESGAVVRNIQRGLRGKRE